MNVWTFSGRVGADAELRTTTNGENVLSFRVANDIGFGDRRTTQWVSCSYWGKRAEAVANYIKKGDKISVSGELKLETYPSKQSPGVQESKLAVRVNDLDLAARSEASSGGGEYDQSINSRQPASSGGQRGGGKPAPAFDVNDDF